MVIKWTECSRSWEDLVLDPASVTAQAQAGWMPASLSFPTCKMRCSRW